uniref:Uncharacterized protein n=1 Tax=Arundo donax TaxID=35708 RepID=A0A0A9AV47_ARUDO
MIGMKLFDTVPQLLVVARGSCAFV